MKIIILTTILLNIFSQKSFSQNLPREWMMLFDCIHKNQKKLTPDMFNSINSNLNQFNTSLNHISPERVASFMKAILYRHILENPPTVLGSKKDARSIVFIEKFFNEYDKKHKTQVCAFTNWIIEALQSDFRDVKNNGGYANNSLSSAKNPIEAKGVTLQNYVSNWVDFFHKNIEDKDSLLIAYYGTLLIQTEKLLRNFTFYSPSQPTNIKYINWTFTETFTDNTKVNSPVDSAPLFQDEKSAAEVLERNIPTSQESDKSKSQEIDNLIKKKKQEEQKNQNEEI